MPIKALLNCMASSIYRVVKLTCFFKEHIQVAIVHLNFQSLFSQWLWHYWKYMVMQCVCIWSFTHFRTYKYQFHLLLLSKFCSFLVFQAVVPLACYHPQYQSLFRHCCYRCYLFEKEDS